MSAKLTRMIEKCQAEKRPVEEGSYKFNWSDVDKYSDNPKYEIVEGTGYCSDEPDEDHCYSDPDDYVHESSPHDGGSNILNKLRLKCACLNEMKKRLGRWCWGGMHFRGQHRVDTDGSIEIGTSGSPKTGGSGAIVRDANVKVLAASSMVSPKGPVSVLYHKLEGVKLGLHLAKANRLCIVHLGTGSYAAYELILKKYTREFYLRKDSDEVLKILDEIDEMLSRQPGWTVYVSSSPKGANLAAKYLSKLFKEIKVSRHDAASPEKMKELIHQTFGEKLNEILEFDATGKNMSKAGRVQVPNDDDDDT